MPLKVRDIVDTVTTCEEPKEIYKNVLEDIGHHFIRNAERLSENIVDEHAGMKIEIDIPISDIVTITFKNTEFVTKTKQTEGK